MNVVPTISQSSSAMNEPRARMGLIIPSVNTYSEPQFNHYAPEGKRIAADQVRPAAGFQSFFGQFLQGFPDVMVEINEQIAEHDLVATRKTLRGTHRGELWGHLPTGNVVSLEFIDIFRVRDGKLVEHWTSMDIAALRAQIETRPD